MEVDAASYPTDAMGTTETKKTRGRQKIEIKKLEDKSKRQVTFSKRRKGLFKKAKEITTLCGVEIAILALSSSGKLYKNDTAEAVLDRFQADSGDHSSVSNSLMKEKEADEGEYAGGLWWDQPMENFSPVELEKYVMALKDLRENAAERLEELSIMNSNCLWPWVSDQNVNKAEFLRQYFGI